MLGVLERHHAFERPHDVRDETAVAPAEREAAADFARSHHRAALEIDRDDLAGPESIAIHDLVFVGREHADLRRDANQSIGSGNHARGAEAVAVERSADEAAVGEDQRGRSIPRLAHERLELIERAHIGRHVAIALPRRRHQARERMRQ